MQCGNRNCECHKCPECHEILGTCICGLLKDTEALLNQNDYTYEDFAHSAKYLLERWIAKKA